MPFARSGGLLLACLLILVALNQSPGRVPEADAASFVVDSTADWTDADPGDGICATVTGACTLRAAIQETNALAGSDTIILPAGWYGLAIPIPASIVPEDENLSTVGDLDVRDNLTISGAGATSTTIDANQIDKAFHVPIPGISLTLEDLAVRNSGFLEGGVVSTTNDTSLTVVRSHIRDNHGNGISGFTDLSVSDSLVSGNIARYGIYGVATMSITRTTVTMNAGDGGIRLATTSFLDNVTVTANIGDVVGGLDNSSGNDVTVQNSTIAGNTATLPSGVGGIDNNNDPLLKVQNTIIAGNTGNGGGNCEFALPGSLGNNISSDTSCALAAAGDLNSTDPLLGSLQDNGGPTLTHALLPGSPALDAGNNGACLPDDQRGVARPVDGNGDTIADCDIGSVETSCVQTTDVDCDGVVDGADNCPTVPNGAQSNTVHPGSVEGDACDDPDADGVPDFSDNCPDTANPDQADLDIDLTGDACDADADGDGVADDADLCPAGPATEAVDASGCSDYDVDPDADGVCTPGAASGGPSSCADRDNCPFVANPGQEDFDTDMVGDACMVRDRYRDEDGDGYPNFKEAAPLCALEGNENDDYPDDSIRNDGCPALGAPETNCVTSDDDGDTVINDGCPQVGMVSEGDLVLGTDPLVRCGEGPEPGQSNAWPSDLISGGGVLDSTDRINVLDVTSFVAPVQRLNTRPTDPGFDSRWDLVPGITLPFTVNIAVNDVIQLLAGRVSTPPMFGGQKVFGGPACTDP